jgi:selenocysteine lyase/cysteine desulfurase
VFGDNHPSSNAAWKTKAERFGYQVVTVPVISPHPGAEAYIDAFAKAITPRTRVLAFTHVTNSVGDLLPAAELCAMARAKGVLTLVDGAQTFGVLNVNLGEMQPDFYSGSLHKWPCGPKETGVLFLARATHDRVWPSIVSLYPGTVGVSRKLEGMGQRDDAALAALGAAVAFQTTIGRAAIETRVRALAQALITGLTEIRGVTVWTHNDPRRSLAVVTAKPADLDVRKVAATLRAEDRIVVATRGGQDRPGLRFSPHFYNTMDEIERAVGAVKRLVAQGA